MIYIYAGRYVRNIIVINGNIIAMIKVHAYVARIAQTILRDMHIIAIDSVMAGTEPPLIAFPLMVISCAPFKFTGADAT